MDSRGSPHIRNLLGGRRAQPRRWPQQLRRPATVDTAMNNGLVQAWGCGSTADGLNLAPQRRTHDPFLSVRCDLSGQLRS